MFRGQFCLKNIVGSARLEILSNNHNAALVMERLKNLHAIDTPTSASLTSSSTALYFEGNY
jgi:hypothetical protein